MFIRQVHAYEEEVVQIRWTLNSGEEFTQRVSVPVELRTIRCPNCAATIPASPSVVIDEDRVAS